MGLHPKTYRYASKRSGDEDVAFGCGYWPRSAGGCYRRLGLMLKRQSIKLNRKKLYQLYKEERLSVRKHGGRNGRWARGHR